ncbi:MAG: LptA/OstA family protein [Rickettsiaceae bacterium]|nr:LptA/OstA family protein [Rickettsiaceae bacterium]
MLRVYFLLISLFCFFDAHGFTRPVIILSDKLIMNKPGKQMIYEGNVKILFENYCILTKKIIFNMIAHGQKTELAYAEFPTLLKIVSNDNKEVVIAPNARYDAKKSTIVSKGDIRIEKDGQLYMTSEVEIKLGKFINVQQNLR